VALLEVAQVIEQAFEVGGVRAALGAQRAAFGRPVGGGEARRASRELVQQDRMPREQPRRPRASGRQVRGALEHLRELQQQRVIRLAPVDRFEERDQAHGRGLRAVLGRDRRDDLGQELFALGANRGRELAIARGARELDQAPGHGLRVADARFLEIAREPVGIGRGLGIHEPRGEPGRILARGLHLEERAEGFLHVGTVRIDLRGELFPAGAVHGIGDDRAMGLVARQRLRLLVVVVLQPMLQAAKEVVGLAQRLRARRLDEAARCERLQGPARGGQAQPGIASAPHHLQELHGEFDLADAARAHLDVVGLAPPHRRLEDARVQVAQLLEHHEVEIAPIHERLHERRHRIARTRDHAALEPRVALPGAAVRHEVVLEGRERRHERAAVAEGAKAHVHAEGLSLGSHVGKERDHFAAGARELLGIRGLVAEKDEVHVGRDVQFLAAQLSQRRHDEARLRGLHGRRDAFVGERGHCREDFIQGREAVEIPMGERDHRARAQQAKARGERLCGIGERRPHLRAIEGARFAAFQLAGQPGMRRNHAGGVVRQAKGAVEGGPERRRGGALRH